MNRVIKNIVISIIISVVLTTVVGLINSSLKINFDELKGISIQTDLMKWDWSWSVAFTMFLVVLIISFNYKKGKIRNNSTHYPKAFSNTPFIPLFKSKSEPDTFYYVTIGRKPSVAEIESGKARIDLPAMKYLSEQSYESYVAIPNSLVDDMEIEVSHSFKKGIFSVLNGGAYGEATVYLLKTC